MPQWTWGCIYFFLIFIFIFFWYIPRSGIAESYGSSTFNFLRNLHIIFLSGYTKLHSHQQCTRVLFSPHLYQHLFFICGLFDDSPSDGYELIPHCVFLVFFKWKLLSFFLSFFLYFWLCWVFVSVRGLSLVAASGGHSSLWCTGLSLSRPLLLRNTSSRRAGSVVVAHGPSCSAACGIFPDQGSNPCRLHWQADSQPLRHQGSPSLWFWFAFPWWLVVLSIFSYACWPSVCCLWKNVYSSTLPIF